MKCAGVIIGLAFALGARVEAAEIKVISTGGARAVMTSLVPEFERKSGHKVGIDFGTPGNMRDRLLQGEAADVALAIAAILPDLEKAGKIAAGTRMEFAASYVGVVVRAGAPKLDVSTPDGLKQAILAARRSRCPTQKQAPSLAPHLSAPRIALALVQIFDRARNSFLAPDRTWRRP